MTNEEKLQKAERDYPAGTEFISPRSKDVYTIPAIPIYKLVGTDDIIIANSHIQPYIRYRGQWAEIVSKPEEKGEGIPTVYSLNPVISNLTGAIDIENTPRYKELLDEEANKTKYWVAKDDKRFYKNYFHLIEREGIKSIVNYAIEKSAQRRYFSELIAEKDKEIERQKERCMLTEELYEDSIKQIEQLKQEIKLK